MTQTQSPANSQSGKLAPYDVSDHLRSPEEMAAYLDAWFDEFPEDVSGIARAVGDIARAKGMTKVAKSLLKNPACANMGQLPSPDARSPGAQRLPVLLRVD